MPLVTKCGVPVWFIEAIDTAEITYVTSFDVTRPVAIVSCALLFNDLFGVHFNLLERTIALLAAMSTTKHDSVVEFTSNLFHVSTTLLEGDVLGAGLT